MGSRFFSIPGMAPFRRGERSRALPPPEENPNLREYLDSRSPTSHGVLGLDPGMVVDFDLHGEHRQATVISEEGDAKSGKASVFVRSQGNRGMETHEIPFEPHTARTMIQGEPKKVRRAP